MPKIPFSIRRSGRYYFRRRDRVRGTVNAFYESNRELGADTLKSLFETELRHCLATFVSKFDDPSRDPLARIADHHTHASAYDIAQRPRTNNELTDSQRQTLAAAGHEEWDRHYNEERPHSAIWKIPPDHAGKLSW
jgi:transposase InsO family protein